MPKPVLRRLRVKVVTRNLANPSEPLVDRDFEFASESGRRWFVLSHCFWALTHNHSVTAIPAEVPVWYEDSEQQEPSE